MYKSKDFSVHLIAAEGLLREGDISMDIEVETLEIKEANRNYQLDFIKIVSALLIF